MCWFKFIYRSCLEFSYRSFKLRSFSLGCWNNDGIRQIKLNPLFKWTKNLLAIQFNYKYRTLCLFICFLHGWGKQDRRGGLNTSNQAHYCKEDRLCRCLVLSLDLCSFSKQNYCFTTFHLAGMILWFYQLFF